MFMLDRIAVTLFAALFAVGCTTPRSAPPRYALGATPSAAEIRAWDIDVAPDGGGLPAGAGNVSQGRAIYAEKCIACHGASGDGGPGGRLVGGHGSLATRQPILTIGSFWPYASTVYDYINRAMPHDRPQSLKPDEVYALTAFLLFQNGVVAADTMLDAKSLPKVRMPNRNGFTQHDPRPDVRGVRCMQDCK